MASRRRSRWRLIQFVTLYILAATASAKKVSLQDFQHLSISDVVSVACFNAYSSPLTGCTRADFQGAQCSAECAKGVQQESVSIRSNCQGVRIQLGTVLADAVTGGLFEALCPGFVTTTITTTVQPSTSQSEVSIPTLTRGTTTAQTTSSASSTTSLTTSTSAASSEESSTTSSSTTSSKESSTTTEQQSTPSTTDAISTTATSESRSTPSATKTASSGLGSSGGGSPFDPVIIAASARTLPGKTESMVGALTTIWIIALLAG
ncbi:hypothetical protein GGR57DRAFT_32979 [Xylariaceae sp. FL1272]|nr:hypothetical protein GGR57DRAFT_32979 [Xylariaceae sp. FL1272]